MPSPLDLLMRAQVLGRVSGLRRTTAPDNSPLLTTVKSHLKISGTAEDTILQIYINAAVTYVEKMSRRSLFDQTWALTLDTFPNDDKFELYNGPVKSVTTFTTYADDGTPTTTFTGYTLDISGERLFLNEGATWPSNVRDVSAVSIAYVTGHGTTVTALPHTLLQAVLKLTGDFYANRDIACTVTPEMAFGVSDLIASEHRWRL